MNDRPRANEGNIWYTHETSSLLCFWLTVEVAKFSECQNQSARYAFLFMYVSSPPLCHMGFQQGWDSFAKLWIISETTKFFKIKMQNRMKKMVLPNICCREWAFVISFITSRIQKGTGSSRAMEFHPHPLTEPCVKVSPHTALHTLCFVHMLLSSYTPLWLRVV